MNCKPGDLARIVAPYQKNGRDHFVTVDRLAKKYEQFGNDHYTIENGLPAWVCHGAVPDEIGLIQRTLVIGDVCLRPIDNPGEDATDEMVERLGKPVSQPEGVTA